MSDAHQRILGTILTNLPGMLALKDKKLAYTVANPEFCQFLGKGPAEIMGKTDQDLFPDVEAAACAKEDQAVLKSGMARASELQLTTAVGGWGLSRLWWWTWQRPRRVPRVATQQRPHRSSG